MVFAFSRSQGQRWLPGVVAVALVAGLAGCSSAPPPLMPVQEKFGSAATFSRLFDAKPHQTCEAARRALLSQGYIVTTAKGDLVEGQKSFQPNVEQHSQMNIRVVCAPENTDGSLSVGFVTALQDTYALKKSSNSASLGVGVIGSVSVPLAAGHDSMVKIGSETITSDGFYESFFELMRRYLILDEAGVDTSAAKRGS